MKLNTMIQKSHSGQVATATVATPATHRHQAAPVQSANPPTVATVAGVAVAESSNSTYHGLTLAELKTAAVDDWPEIKHDPAMLEAFAHALVAQAMRERCEIPSHYTQAVNCEGCGPVWLWPDSPDRVLACPWCFVRVKGITPPAASYADLLHLTGE